MWRKKPEQSGDIFTGVCGGGKITRLLLWIVVLFVGKPQR